MIELKITCEDDCVGDETFDILRVLQECHNLQAFYFKSPFELCVKDETKAVLSLKCLRILHLDLPACDTAWLLSRISTTSPSIELTCIYEKFGLWDDEIYPAPTVSSSTNPHWQHLMDGIESLNISVGGNLGEFDISIEGIQGVSFTESHNTPPRVSLIFRRYFETNTAALLEAVSDMIHTTYLFPKLTSFNVSSEGFGDPHDNKITKYITTLLRISPVIDTIKLSYFPMHDDWGALVEACQSPSQPFLPLLRSLTVENIGIYPVSSGSQPGLVEFLEAWEHNRGPVSPDGRRRINVSAVHCWFAKEDSFSDVNSWMSSRANFHRIG